MKHFSTFSNAFPHEIRSIICNDNYELAWTTQDFEIMTAIARKFKIILVIKLQRDSVELYRDTCWRYKSSDGRHSGILGLHLMSNYLQKHPVLMWTLRINDLELKCPGNVSIKTSDLVALYTRIGKPIFVNNYKQIEENGKTLVRAGHIDRGCIHIILCEEVLYGYYIFNDKILDARRTWVTEENFNLFLKCVGVESLLRHRGHHIEPVNHKYYLYPEKKRIGSTFGFVGVVWCSALIFAIVSLIFGYFMLD